MKKINYIKIILDLLMSLVFVLLFNKRAVAGLQFHEIAGLTLGLAFIIHIIINFKWVKQITYKFFKSKINLKTRIGYIIDLLLLIDMMFIIGTGIAISQALFPGVFSGSAVSKILHTSLSYIALLLIGIHIGLHWGWVMNIFKNTLKISGRNKASKIITAVLAISIFAFGSYNVYSSGYFAKAVPITSSYQQPPRDRIPSDSQISGNNMPSSTDGANFKGPNGGEKARGDMKDAGSSDIFSIIYKNLSIISFFSIITFYIEKIFKMKSRKKV
jgi:hypothetical protein